MTEYFNYILRCADGTLYSGFTTDPARRLAAHNAGTGAKYTRGRRPVAMAALWQWPDRSGALKAERLVKRLTRAEKESLVARKARLENGRRVSEKRLKKLAAAPPAVPGEKAAPRRARRANAKNTRPDAKPE